MTTFPGSPKLLKGAIVGVDPLKPLASIIIFQYNPETLTRTLSAQAASSGYGYVDQHEVLRLKGPPRENISLQVEIDATDQLAQGDVIATSLGIYPALASLELLLYPPSATMIANEVLAAIGVIEIVPPEAPLVLFVWGPNRVLPVRLTSFSITEEAFDPGLNPLRARVNLDLQVLTYQDLGLTSVGGALFMAHQVAKEALGTINGVSSVASSFSHVVNIGG